MPGVRGDKNNESIKVNADTKVQDTPLNIILPRNYDAELAASFFMQDAQNVMGLISPIFRGGMSTGDPATASIIIAANKAIASLQQDITSTQGFLNQIVTTNEEVK